MRKERKMRKRRKMRQKRQKRKKREEEEEGEGFEQRRSTLAGIFSAGGAPSILLGWIPDVLGAFLSSGYWGCSMETAGSYSPGNRVGEQRGC